MEITTCFECGTRVVPRVDGLCPACLKPALTGFSGPEDAVAAEKESPALGPASGPAAALLETRPPRRPPKPPGQRDVNRYLKRGVVYSILWLFGFGSLYSLHCALAARRIIIASGGRLTGTRRVWWCFLVGGFGVSFWGMILVTMVVNSLTP